MDKNTGSSGVGLSTVLTLIFVVLKLVGVIDWSWWWVVSPTLISTGLAILLIVGYVIYALHENKKYGFEYKKGKNDKWKF